LGTAVCQSSQAATSHAAASAAIPQNLSVRIAVISDVHANLYALETVLGEIDRDPPDEIWCLGDTIGYGPRPNECCKLVRERCALTLVGNHDLVALGSADVGVEDFNPEAGAASLWTAAELTAESREFLSSLEPQAAREALQLFHGSPRDPLWDYVIDELSVVESFELTDAPIVLVGHSHVATAVLLADDTLHGGVAKAELVADLGLGRWLLNPGSVGQPRDGDPRAAYLRLDLKSGAARFGRIAYPFARTQAEIRERGLPD
jgi:diadenosine tetraphosphatase ApaH/serine/threonine PP2A family protein phosphatase